MIRISHRAFTLVELLVVVVVMGILAAVVVPRFAGATVDAKTAAAESSVAGVRAGIAAFRSRAIIAGADPYPTLAELTDGSSVLDGDPPRNPITAVSGVQAVSRAQAESRSVSAPASYGWNYFVDNASDPPVAIFYLNTDETTSKSDGAGGSLNANQL